MLFDESTLRKINQLTLVASRVRAGAMKGERRSSRRGSSVEFADYRNYVPGDDLRRLDWNIYARLEKPFIKLLEEEEDLAVYILIDGSLSMDWGEEKERNKFRYTLKLAGGLGAIALSTGDMVTIGFLQGGRVTDDFGPTRGGNAMSRMFKFLEGLAASGETDLNKSIQQFLVTPRRPGLVIIISDLLSAAGYESGLRNLLGRGHEAVLVHILAPDEMDPQFAGDVQLVDAESNQEQDISFDSALRTQYQQRVQNWIQETKNECRKQNVRYLNLVTDNPFDQALMLEMRKAGVVK